MPGSATFDNPDAPSGGPDPSAISDYYQGQLNADTQQLADIAKTDKPQEFNQAPPERQPGITSVAPLLIGLAALGGKAAGLHATTMLGATNGMVSGLIQGNEQRYRDQKAAYDDAYSKWRDKWDQQQKIYNEMRQVYKGRVDADLRALQFARQVTGDQAKVTQNDVKNHQQAEKYALDLQKLDLAKAHEGADEYLKKRKLDLEAQKLAQETGSPKNGQLAAALADHGVSIQGFRQKGILQQVLAGLWERHPNKTADEIAEGVKSGQIDMKVSSTEASKLATREAAIAPVEKSINQPGGFLDQAEKAINDVNFPPLKKEAELKHYAMAQSGDPKLSAYETRVTELRQEYAIVLAKGGLTSDASRAEAARVVPELITPAQFKEIKQAIYQGIETAKKGVRGSIEDIGGTSPSATLETPPPKYAYDAKTGKPTHQLINGNWVPIAH